jgi:hypothetical protein
LFGLGAIAPGTDGNIDWNKPRLGIIAAIAFLAALLSSSPILKQAQALKIHRLLLHVLLKRL